MSDSEKRVGDVSLEELKAILKDAIRLEVTQLELRLNDKFALRSEMSALTTAFNMLKEHALVRGGPSDRAIDESKSKIQELHDANIRSVGILDEVPKLKTEVGKLKLWRAGLAGAAGLATFLAGLAVAVGPLFK